MSNKAITWSYAQTLKPGPKFVLVTLGDMADQEHSCYPGTELLSELTGFGATAIAGHIKQLITDGYVSIERRHKKNGARTSDRYYLDPIGVRGLRKPIVAVPKKAPESASAAPENVTPDSGVTPVSPNPGFRDGLTPDSEESNPGIRGYVPYIAFNPQLTQSNEPSDCALIASDEVELSIDDWFEQFWAVYPRREAKARARTAFAKAAKLTTGPQLVAAAKAYRDNPNRNANPTYLPHPATWLNGSRWEDEIPEALPAPAPPQRLSNADQALIEYQQIYGGPDGHGTGNPPALDPGFGDR